MKSILIIIFFCLTFVSFEAEGSHIVGGEFSYQHISGNNYRVTFYLYRDCLTGNPNALEDDKDGTFGILNLDNDSWYNRFKLSYTDTFNTPANFNNICIKNPPPVCLNRMQFIFNITIPPNTNGYQIVYQRCCRNQAVNMNNAGGSSVGSTFYTFINPQYGINNSAVFVNYPPQIICINNPLNYNNGAIDPDAGDSLSYELCTAKNYSNNNTPNPDINDLLKPPYANIPYSFGYSGTTPMNGSPNISINPLTGLITGTPTVQGRFVVTVCCTEWRNRIAINVNRRDFQFEVTNCSKAVIANTPVFSDEPNVFIAQCDSTFVQFKNNSSGGIGYHWDFGVASSLTDTSNLFEPTFNYPDTGTYIVTLTVNPGSTCQDSIRRIVKVYPKFYVNFNFSGLLCPGSPIQFTDSSWGTMAGPNKWKWSFGDNTFETNQNPSHSFSSGIFNTTLVAKNSFGCSDTARATINIKPVNVVTNNDTIILKNISLPVTTTGAINYVWSPNTNISSINTCCPTFNFPDTGRYQYIVQAITTEGCIDADTLNIIVVPQPIIWVPNAFSPNGDGINDVLKIIQGGYGRLNFFRVFDRWGEQLFYSVNLSESWTGTDKGKPCAMDTYYWMASATNILGQTMILKGDIILVR
jgi:gliding motility-associated-like protein